MPVPDDEDFQSRATREGLLAREIAEGALRGAGFRIVDRQRRLDTGVTVNFVANDKAGVEWAFDVSGSFTSRRAGLIRTDTMWKTLGRANVLNGMGDIRLILLTTNLPPRGSTGDKALRAAAHTFIDAVEMVTDAGKAKLCAYASGNRQPVALPGYLPAAEIYGQHLVRRGDGLVQLPAEFAGDALVRRPSLRVSSYTHLFKAYLPSKTRGGDLISVRRRKEVGSHIISILSGEAGGCTSSDALGSWIDHVSGIVHEEVTVIEAFSASLLPTTAMVKILKLILEDLEQASAAIVVDGVMYQFGDA